MDEPITLNGPAVAGRIAETNERREAAAKAVATPLPGPLADAFAIAPDIKVDIYSVRPFLEGDFELLNTLKHPLYELLIEMFSGKKTDADYFPSGPAAWELCCIFSHSFDDIQTLPVEEIRKQAKSEFSRLPTAAVLKLHQAIMKQVVLSVSTAIAYGASEDEDSKKNP